ncbi:hypothetical protein ADL22_33270 [Streptomyces sp. NRRL F-4489]|uniref:hypothetical protein n=1 Tax=Streptomyces sp. NRRL F-4489 TaxID=1609095 RepID=UPI00074882A1|nr:hypothetical protein [Streptomyces sp. NRRL F-4489]KUL33418.1 hypothetical protein ADL22_33270 [Streptomyces sp. NRRL F-4489]
MDAKKRPGHPFQRISLPHQPPRLPPPAARRRVEEDTPIFDQLLKEWRAGAVRPVVTWPVDEPPGKIRPGAVVGDGDGRPRPRTRTEEPEHEPVRHPAAHPDR